MSRPKVFVAARLDADVVDRIDELAAVLECTRTEALDKLIRSGLLKYQEKRELLSNPLAASVMGWLAAKPDRYRGVAALAGLNLSEVEASELASEGKSMSKASKKSRK
jgi:hypothetical protein